MMGIFSEVENRDLLEAESFPMHQTDQRYRYPDRANFRSGVGLFIYVFLVKKKCQLTVQIYQVIGCRFVHLWGFGLKNVSSLCKFIQFLAVDLFIYFWVKKLSAHCANLSSSWL